MAIALRRPEPGLIHHSDRGSQYVATEYQMTLKQYAIVSSRPGKATVTFAQLTERSGDTMRLSRPSARP